MIHVYQYWSLLFITFHLGMTVPVNMAVCKYAGGVCVHMCEGWGSTSHLIPQELSATDHPRQGIYRGF